MFEKVLACIEVKRKKNKKPQKKTRRERENKFFSWEKQKCLWNLKLFFVTPSIHI